MTTRPTKPKITAPLPDPPEREPEDMTSFDHLTLSGSVHHLVQHLGNPETTIVAGERYVTREPGVPATERMVPDLLIAFNADPGAYRDDNGYVISAQGKPPDFVMEIASRRTGRRDVVQMLLSSGAKTEMPNRRDETALISAIEEEEVEIARLLIEAGANLDVVGHLGRTLLELAEDNRDKEMVKLLKEATR